MPVKLIAVNVGPDTSDRKTSFAISVANQPVQPIRIQQDQAGQATISLPSSAFSPYAKTDAISLVSASINVSISKKTGWWIFSSWSKPRTYAVPMWISLIPEKAATIRVTGQQPVLGWQFSRNECFDQTGPDGHCAEDCKKWYGYSTSMSRSVAGGNEPVVGYERISSVTSFSLVGGPGGFDVDHRTDITENGRKVIGYWRARTRPTTYRLCFNIEKYQRIRTEPLEEKKMTLNYGETRSFRVPAQATEISVSGTTINNVGINLIVGGSNNGSIIEIAADQIDGNERVITLRAKKFLQLY